MTLPVLVRDYIDARLESALGVSLKEYVDTRLDDVERARNIAHSALELRLEGMNQFRAALTDQAKTFINRDEHDTLCERIAELERHRARLEGRSSVTVLVAVASLIVSVLALLEKFMGR